MATASSQQNPAEEDANSERPVDYRLSRDEDDLERLERYCVGGYHPIHIHDHLNGRYEIVHKLGFDSYSTIWLARDHETDRNVAVKILTADNDRPDESRILSILHASDDTPSITVDRRRSLVPKLLDHLEIEGPNGHHQCLVTLPTSCSISDSRDPSFSTSIFQPQVARVVAAQVVQAVAYVHAKSVSLLHLPPDQFYEAYDDQQELLDIERNDKRPLTANVPRYAVPKVNLGTAAEDLSLSEARIALADFGESFEHNVEGRLEVRTPLMFRAPEHVLSLPVPVTFAPDNWSLACVIFTLLGQQHLFKMGLANEDKILQKQIHALGLLPQKLFESWSNRATFFDCSQQPLPGKAAESLSQRIENADHKAETGRYGRRTCAG